MMTPTIHMNGTSRNSLLDEIKDATHALSVAIEKLCAVPGIGPWTAHYIAIRALREPDGFPASDIGLLRALAENGVRPSPKAVLARKRKAALVL